MSEDIVGVELLPCPFCGGEARLFSVSIPMLEDCADVQVSCSNCDTVGPSVMFDQTENTEGDIQILEAEARTLWNTRTLTPEPSAADMAAFGASDAACYFYPGEHQSAERVAFGEGAAQAAAHTNRGEVERLRDVDLAIEQARFLLDRLNDFDDWSLDQDDMLRNWSGHVDPARSRLADTLARAALSSPDTVKDAAATTPAAGEGGI